MNIQDLDLHDRDRIEGIVEDYRKDAMKSLGEKGVAEWKEKGDIYEVDDIYGLTWQECAALSDYKLDLMNWIAERL